MSDTKLEVIKCIAFHPGFKVAMTFSEKFYLDFFNCAIGTGERGYYDLAYKKGSNSNVLCFLCTGDVTAEYYAMNLD